MKLKDLAKRYDTSIASASRFCSGVDPEGVA
jgi:hypothetical protein